MNDLINRQAAIDAIDKYIGKFDCIDVNFLDGLKTTKKILNDLPSAERRGRWVYNANFAEPPFKCSACGKSQGRLSNYCPDCGANMDGDTE